MQSNSILYSIVRTNLTGASFREANLVNANFADCRSSCVYATLTDADLTAADVRGALLDIPAGATTVNLIRPDGHIDGLDLDSGARLVVRDYENHGHTIPITVDQHLTMGPDGTLEFTFADDVNLASQRGHTFSLFDWTGVSPSGEFLVDSPYDWDLSSLYTTGEVTLNAIPEPNALAMLLLGVLLILAHQLSLGVFIKVTEDR